MNLTGTISSLPDSRGNVTVQMGILRSQVHISDLEIIEEANPYAPKSFKRTSKGKLKMSKSLSVSPEINLLGKTVDEAVSELDKYLDDALLSHLSTVRVVHGKEPEHSEKEFTNSCAVRSMLSPTVSGNSEKETPASRSWS